MIYRILLASWVLLMATSQCVRGDLIYRGQAQQNGTVETSGATRAIYLGRISDTAIPGGTEPFHGIYAGVSIGSNASNVALFLGNGTSDFSSLQSSNLVFDTGLRFTNTVEKDVQAIFLPGFPPPTPGFGPPAPLSLAAGTALRNQLLTVNHLDAWLVGSSSSTFIAPSPNNFFVQVNAVPEPSSIVLSCVAAFGALGGLLRRKLGFGRAATA